MSTSTDQSISRFLENLENIITCPISHQIFANPVVAADGHVYEESEIREWFETNNTSPTTRLKMSSTNTTHSFEMQHLVEKFLEKFPEKKKIQFDASNVKMTVKEFVDACKSGDQTKIKKFIDQVDDINLKSKDFEYDRKIIHYVCRYSSLEMLKHVIQKGGRIDSVDFINYTCFHMANMNYDHGRDIIRYLLEEQKPTFMGKQKSWFNYKIVLDNLPIFKIAWKPSKIVLDEFFHGLIDGITISALIIGSCELIRMVRKRLT